MTRVWRQPGLLVFVLITAGSLAGASALAAGHGGSGRGGSGRAGHSGAHHAGKNHAGQHHQHVGSVAAIGAAAVPVYWPWSNYPPGYPAVAIAATAPVEYIERGEQEAQPEEYWFYCAKAQGYFPYVGECADGWERVPTTPPPGS
jgi:hypothetical protein